MTLQQQTTSGAVEAHAIIHKEPRIAATLRRAETYTEALFEGATHDALRILESAGLGNRKQALPIVCLLAHVKQHVPGRLGRQLRQANVSEARFKRLAFASREQATEELRRMIPALNGQLDVDSLANTLYYWGDKTRDRLATDYYTKERPT